MYSNVWFLSVFVIYLNSNTSIIFIYTKLLLKKNLPHIKSKNYSLLSRNFYGFFFKFFKTFQNFCYLNSYIVITNLHPFTLTYVIFLLFKSQIFLLITIFIPINKVKCSIGFQLLTVFYLIFRHYSMLHYLLLYIYIYIYIYTHTHTRGYLYISLLSIITLNQKYIYIIINK